MARKTISADSRSKIVTRLAILSMKEGDDAQLKAEGIDEGLRLAGLGEDLIAEILTEAAEFGEV